MRRKSICLPWISAIANLDISARRHEILVVALVSTVVSTELDCPMFRLRLVGSGGAMVQEGNCAFGTRYDVRDKRALVWLLTLLTGRSLHQPSEAPPFDTYAKMET